jgi:transcriptional regulator with XRE-family HTH domain
VNHLQRQLDARRRHLRLSYRALEDLTGLNRSTLWSLINGPMRQPPKKEQVELLAKALDWPAIYLQQMVGEQFGFHVYEVRSEDLQVVVASWDELSERDRRTIVRMVEELRRENGPVSPNR